MKWIRTKDIPGITLLILLMALLLIALPVLTQAAPSFTETGKSRLGGVGIHEDTPSWETKAPIPQGRVFHATIADNYGHIYVIGGTSDAFGLTRTDTIYQYETSNDTWTELAQMETTLTMIAGAAVGSKLYIPGDDLTATTYVYSIATDTWSTIPANGGYTARSQYSALAIGTDVYVLGGVIASTFTGTSEVWILDTITETWTQGVSMQKTRAAFGAGMVGTSMIAAGGVDFPSFTPEMTVEVFDGTEWAYVEPIPTGEGEYTRWAYLASGSSGDQLWLAGGRRDGSWNVLDHAGYYDLSENTWTTSPDLPVLSQPRVYLSGAVAKDGYFYALGGRDSSGTFLYDNNERLYVGSSTGSLEVTITPDEAEAAGAQWSIDGGNTWYDSGAEIALEPGDYTIVFKDIDGWDSPDNLTDIAVEAGIKTEQSGTYALAVKAVTAVTLNLTDLELTVGDEAAILIATVEPADATNPTIHWSSSDETVATVAANSPAEVTPVAPGTAIITATTADGAFTAHCTVVVTAAEDPNGDDNGDDNGQEPLPDTGTHLGYLFGGLLMTAAGLGVKRKIR